MLKLLIFTPVPHYSVAARGVEDIQKAVKFASEKDLYLVVKNTGHSQYVTTASLVLFRLTFTSLGRSSGRGSFSIWTHNLKGKEWHQSFSARGAPKGTPGVPAVTLQAGEQWLGMAEPLSARQNSTDYILPVRCVQSSCGTKCHRGRWSCQDCGISWWIPYWRRPFSLCTFLRAGRGQ